MHLTPQDYVKSLKSENQQLPKPVAPKNLIRVTSQVANRNLQLLLHSLNHFLEGKTKKVPP